MELDPQWLKDLTTIAAALAAAFVAALWLSLIFWVFRDIRQRSRDPFLITLAVLIATVLFLPGVLIYLIIRPNITIEEEYQTVLEEEALLQTIEEPSRCPGCGRVTQTDWMICPSCHTRLQKQCHNCKKLMELSWDLCPFCGTLVPGARREDVTGEDILSRLPVTAPETGKPAKTRTQAGKPVNQEPQPAPADPTSAEPKSA
jgi:RNA polymerase subunit RPABC4/transcription elongation factor Spt4